MTLFSPLPLPELLPCSSSSLFDPSEALFDRAGRGDFREAYAIREGRHRPLAGERQRGERAFLSVRVREQAADLIKDALDRIDGSHRHALNTVDEGRDEPLARLAEPLNLFVYPCDDVREYVLNVLYACADRGADILKKADKCLKPLL